MGFSLINHPFQGTPMAMEPPNWLLTYGKESPLEMANSERLNEEKSQVLVCHNDIYLLGSRYVLDITFPTA